MTENHEFDEIYKECKKLVLKAAYTYSGNFHMAEDITQSTFLQLYIYYDDMKHTNIKSWLYTTAKHQALNYIKKAGREVLQEEMSDDNYILETADSAEDIYMNAVEDQDYSVLHSQIFEALLGKNKRWYDAIMLVYYLEIPQARVAEEMGIRIEVLHSLLHRAKSWIKKEFGIEYHDMKQV